MSQFAQSTRIDSSSPPTAPAAPSLDQMLNQCLAARERFHFDQSTDIAAKIVKLGTGIEASQIIRSSVSDVRTATNEGVRVEVGKALWVLALAAQQVDKDTNTAFAYIERAVAINIHDFEALRAVESIGRANAQRGLSDCEPSRRREIITDQMESSRVLFERFIEEHLGIKDGMIPEHLLDPIHDGWDQAIFALENVAKINTQRAKNLFGGYRRDGEGATVLLSRSVMHCQSAIVLFGFEDHFDLTTLRPLILEGHGLEQVAEYGETAPRRFARVLINLSEAYEQLAAIGGGGAEAWLCYSFVALRLARNVNASLPPSDKRTEQLAVLDDRLRLLEAKNSRMQTLVKEFFVLKLTDVAPEQVRVKAAPEPVKAELPPIHKDIAEAILTRDWVFIRENVLSLAALTIKTPEQADIQKLTKPKKVKTNIDLAKFTREYGEDLYLIHAAPGHIDELFLSLVKQLADKRPNSDADIAAYLKATRLLGRLAEKTPDPQAREMMLEKRKAIETGLRDVVKRMQADGLRTVLSGLADWAETYLPAQKPIAQS